jgi:hypothetical protein
MRLPSNGQAPWNISGGDIALPTENSRELLGCCFKSMHHFTWFYLNHVSAEESIAGGSLSYYLLSIREVDLLETFKIGGFYNKKRGAFLFRVSKAWVAASFDAHIVATTSWWPYKKIPLIKIGLGEHLRHTASQSKEKLDPPRFRRKTDPKGKSSKESLMLLFDKPPQTQVTTNSKTMATPSTGFHQKSNSFYYYYYYCCLLLLRVPSYLPVKLSQRFNIASSNKPKLATKLIFEMDT